MSPVRFQADGRDPRRRQSDCERFEVAKKSEKMKKVRVTEWPLRRDGQHEDSNRTHLADLNGQNCIRQHLHGTIAHPGFITVRTLLMIHLFRDNAHDSRWRITRRTVHVVIVGQSDNLSKRGNQCSGVGKRESGATRVQTNASRERGSGGGGWVGWADSV
jgi:hypothetical protein